MSVLVWFRQDLRLHDQPALAAACASGEPVQALFIATPEQWMAHELAPMRADLLERQLNQLGRELAELGIPLHLLEVQRFADIAEQLARFVGQRGIRRLCFNREIPIDEQRRDAAVVARLAHTGVQVSQYEQRCVLPPGTLHTGSGHMYQVFTPFARAWLKRLLADGFELLPPPGPQGAALDWQPRRLDYPKRDSGDWPVGEAAVLARLRDFCARHLRDYGELRDYPAQDATSRLSPYLALGILSPRQCLAAMQVELGELPVERGQPGFVWLNELIWRDFYQHLLAAHPQLAMGRPFKAHTAAIPWRKDRALFAAWCQGKTGYPIVDAAMRCLNESGWMHNRLRMVVASFLAKDLHLPWWWGEHYFMRHLIDGELAANNGGWQWAASTGADAAPYFRIFNPTTQGQRFDPQGDFIRAWLPELAALPAKAIHTPHAWLAARGLADSYPQPVVEHARAREQALALFSEGGTRHV